MKLPEYGVSALLIVVKDNPAAGPYLLEADSDHIGPVEGRHVIQFIDKSPYGLNDWLPAPAAA